MWKRKDEKPSTSDSQLTKNVEMTGDLTKKNCTTTFRNLCPDHSDTYYFRLDCKNKLKYTYVETPLNIVVKGKFQCPFTYKLLDI